MKTNLDKLQITQNSALRIATGCTSDTNTQHLHIEIKTLPLSNHLKLHASQLRQKSLLPTHPPHDLTQLHKPPRDMKETIFYNWNNKTTNLKNDTKQQPTLDTITQNIKKIHTKVVSEYIKTQTKRSPLTPSTKN